MSDVFISHSSKDKEIADKVVQYFEDKGLSCWISSRDIVPGAEWAAAISTAITASKVFLLIYTENSAASEQVVREVSLAEHKKGVYVVPYKTDETPLKGSFEYYLSASHFIYADYSQNEYKLEELYDFVAGIVGKNIRNITNNTYIDNVENLNIKASGNLSEGVSKKLPLYIGVVAAIVAVIVILILLLNHGNEDEPKGDKLTQTPPATEAVTPTTDVSEPTATPDPTISPEPSSSDKKPVSYEGSETQVALMTYINTYGNHFENDKGEYYSIKHSYGPVTITWNGEERTIENSRIYLTSRYETSAEPDTPLELGVYNGDLYLNVWLYYNIKTKGYELDAYEDEEKGRSKGVIKVKLNDSFTGKIAEEDIYEYNGSGWFEKDEFIANVEDLLTVLLKGLETDLEDMDNEVSLDTLGLGNIIK
ncbi:MAG: toll/interleukin-1 receptor domain-containing protein [Lachnospiraceae bacterium]|nr:toll/interleukin-1 receptor domain-containing protein [Lachnospiraceae bacterium]